VKIDALRVDGSRPFRLRDFDPRDRCGFADRDEATQQLDSDLVRLRELQDVFSANGTYGLLIVIQGVDAAGKDGIIKHVMSGMNPQGVRVYPFRAPSEIEVVHDYLWRATRELPERSRIAIFNRSYYEEVLVVRIHPEFLERQRLPAHLVGPDIWKRRYREIVEFERYLVENGINVVKFCLNLSRKEQLERLLERIEEKDKNWKFSEADLETPQRWDAYQDAYEMMLQETASKHAPWYIIPADRKWVSRLAVANILVDHIDALKLSYPRVSEQDAMRLAAAKQYIEAELARD
jgi:PPK2 family polyphosphate:nucleotide phosphotransferase